MRLVPRSSSLAGLALGTLACAAAASHPEGGGASSPTPVLRPGPPAEGAPTLLLEQPALHGERVAFAYAGDLWTARTDGSGLRRLTTDRGFEGRPCFSPDGGAIAFSAEYEGNLDVYVVPVEGGVPRRLTWHPGPDLAACFTPDGSRVAFTSQREVHTRRFLRMFTVPVEGGPPSALPLPSVFEPAWSPDGKHIAYLPQREVFQQWKNYRGGTASRIWVYAVEDHSVLEVPRPEGGCNDTDPSWVGDELWFRSDRGGEFDVWAWRPGGDAPRRLTTNEDFPVLALESDGNRAILEQAGRLHVLDSDETLVTLDLVVTADLVETRPRWAEAQGNVRSASLSPSGKRAVFDVRGDIVTVPAEHGEPRNLTASTDAHDKFPVWSPDGRSVAWFSDAGGEYALWIAPADGKGEARRIELGGSGFYEDARWSPDSERISFQDNSWTLWLLEVASGELTRVAQEPLYGPIERLHHSWSSNSRWLAYTLGNGVNFRTVFLYDVEGGASHAITDGLSDVGEPVFDDERGLLYFTASTDAGPANTWFAMSNADIRQTNSLYAVVLDADSPSPFAPRSDEEEVAEEEESGGEPEAEGDGAEEDAEAEPEEPLVALEGIAQRVVALPLPSAYYRGLEASAGKLLYLKNDDATPFGVAGPSTLCVFDVDAREETELAPGVSWFTLSADGKKTLLRAGSSWSIADTGTPGTGEALDLSSVRVRVDPRAEWPQIFDEAWRINRDWFYDPGMHGADWPAMREKYAAFLPHLTNRRDLNRLIQWMCSEIGVGHHRNGGGDFPFETESVPGGLLGADYEIADGRYRFARVYGGLNWNPGLRAPLTEPGVNVREGEYLLAVDGRDLTPPENLFARFEGTAGRQVELTVGPNADGTDSRTVVVVPVEDELALRNRAWIEGNVQRVTEATNGRVAYVHVPDTAGRGHQYFKRYFFPQADRDAIIVDERYNSGGLFADYVIDLLRRPHISNWAMRYGMDLETPLGAIEGPKVMLIDENAGSGGDMLPWMFKKLGLGPLVGRTTWGGLVGVLGFPELLDGGGITAPNFAIWTEDGFVVENVGVAPDFEVDQLPSEVIAGRDPQLEKAIELALEALEENPPPERTRPPYPIRVRR